MTKNPRLGPQDMTQITLRRANRLQKAINDALSSLEFKADATVSVYDQDPMGTLDAANEKFDAAVAKAIKLTQILAAIRAETAAANAEVGIARLLAEKAAAERRIQILKGLSGRRGSLASRPSPDELQRRVQVTRERFEKAEFHEEATVTVPALTGSMIGDVADALVIDKRKIEKISERLLELNASTMIELPNEDLAWLEANQVI